MHTLENIVNQMTPTVAAAWRAMLAHIDSIRADSLREPSPSSPSSPASLGRDNQK